MIQPEEDVTETQESVTPPKRGALSGRSTAEGGEAGNPPLNALHLPGWTILEHPSLHDLTKPLIFVARPDEAQKPPRCERCEDGGHPKFKEYRSGTISDVPAFGRHVEIRYVDLKRYRCRCGWTGNAAVADIDDTRRMSSRCVSYVVQRAALHSFTDVAREIGVSETTVRETAMSAWEAIPDYEFETPRYLGIDEIILRDNADLTNPGPQKRAVFVDLETSRVLDILNSNTKKAVATWVLKLPNRHRIRIVTTDLEPSYRDVVKALLPDAQLVIDKWHAMKGIWEALDGARIATLRHQGQIVFNDAETLQMRNALRARAIGPTDKRWIWLEAFLSQHPSIGIAYEIKQMFCEIWEKAGDMPSAYLLFMMWQKHVDRLPPHIKEHYLPIAQQTERNITDLLTYFDWPLTNAPTEAMNRVIRKINGAGQGMNLRALRYKVRAYSRARRPKKFFCDRCLKRTPIGQKVEHPVFVNRGKELIYDEGLHHLCHKCYEHTLSDARDVVIERIIHMPKAPRFASSDKLRSMRNERKRRNKSKVAQQPDFFE